MTMTTAQAVGWWANHAIDPAWVAHYAASTGQPHRQTVVDALTRIQPWGSLFEIGCHCGPMLAAITRAFPDARLGGCDVNREAVEAARRWLPSVLEGPFPGVTATWPDQSVDVVLSCYALAYVAPEDLASALGEAARIARQAVVLCEPMAWDGREAIRQDGQFSEWRHAYLPALAARSEFGGWTATCHEVKFEGNYLSGLITVERPTCG